LTESFLALIKFWLRNSWSIESLILFLSLELTQLLIDMLTSGSCSGVSKISLDFLILLANVYLFFYSESLRTQNKAKIHAITKNTKMKTIDLETDDCSYFSSTSSCKTFILANLLCLFTPIATFRALKSRPMYKFLRKMVPNVKTLSCSED
jgi:hypothetical protein